MSKPVQVEVVLSHSEHLPAVDVWLVVDVLRATTVMVRWFEMGGEELFPTESVESALNLAARLKEEGKNPLLMGERNAIAPQGFALGNSPLEITKELTRDHPCAVMATTNGTAAMLKAASTGTPVLAVCARNAFAALDAALSIGRRIGIFCAGRRGRPAWDDTLCAGALVSLLTENFSDAHLADSARLALLTRQASGDFLASLRRADHAIFLEKIGYGDDVAFAGELDVAMTVPELHEIPDSEGMRAVLRGGVANREPLVLKRNRTNLKNPSLASGVKDARDEPQTSIHLQPEVFSPDADHVFFAGTGYRKLRQAKQKKL